MEDVLQRVSDTVTNTPVVITVDIKDRSWLDKLLNRNKVKVFEMTQITLGNLIRISKLLRTIDVKILVDINNGNILDRSYSLMDEHGDTLASIVAIALYNKKQMPIKDLIETIKYNFTAKELLNVLSVVLKQMDVSSFMSTIISIRGLSILENQSANAKPVNGKEVSL